MIDYRRIFSEGLWGNNVVLVQLLALCPTLAVTSTATNGLGMGLATTAVITLSNVLIASLRNFISEQVRIPVFIVLIATLVTLVDMALNAWMHELYKVLGLFIALIVVNCAILGRAEAFAQRNPVSASFVDGLATGLGFTLGLVIIGGVREVIGAGTLFANASGLLGEHFRFLELTLIPEYRGFLLLALPPGGFLVMGFILSLKRVVAARRAERAAAATAPAQA
jgi:electron transport complex protein RnfE